MRFAHACFRTLWPLPRWAVAGACALAVALPLWTTPFPPVTDLPQHVAQVRLWFETLAGMPHPDGTRYIIQWWTPYSLTYWLMGGLWQVLPPVRVGQAMLLLQALGWVFLVHWLAARRQRSAAAAALATTLFFNHTLYWGFVSFMTGGPLFLLWVHVTAREAPMTRRRQLLLVGLAALLYAAHALWFAMALLWFGVMAWALRRPWRTVLHDGLWLLPLAALAALMYSRIGYATTLVEHKTVWRAPVVWRLFTPWLPESVYGGLGGPVEPLALAGVGLWLVAGLVRHGRRLRAASDPVWLLAGGLCLTAGLLLPYQYQYTIEFAERWMPVALTCVLLGAPAWDTPPSGNGDFPGWPRAVATAACVVFCGWTTLVWQAFQRDYLPGLPEALAALPSQPRVVGLDFIKEIPGFRRRPLMQMPTYAQVLHGGAYSLSFAKFPQSFVRYETDAVVGWTDGLEWSPEHLTERDLGYFDVVLAVGDRWAHERLQKKFPRLQPVTGDDRTPWRLYRIGAHAHHPGEHPR
ncbi:hypothetical protein J8C02_01215 [Chloracidobacterium sp. MS 40/45]|uniref:hypothetical protein n=1 Tax=Chloracidobacterium aggregatum TaxID=2851959 RepID=UPI001B8ABC53|nr:hypothetical protein [Chloracidobacterium aggregatum]QUW00168.1 hypothetical protein J8C02_01215 [Chloracidobacterium sp. MS 40/45]